MSVIIIHVIFIHFNENYFSLFSKIKKKLFFLKYREQEREKRRESLEKE